MDYTNLEPMHFKDEILLKQICNCKGSLKYVHESCLIKWLQTKNTKCCELCLRDYDISYEFGSFTEIMMRGVRYVFKDKRRLLRGLLYALYLWIFFRRFMHMIQSSIKFIKHIVIKILGKFSMPKMRAAQQSTKKLVAAVSKKASNSATSHAIF